MSQSIAPGNHRPSRQFRALLRRDLGVAAPIALTAAALLAVAASALAALPLLGRAAMDALAVPPAAGLAERLSLLPELVRIVLLLIPGWCAAAMAIADRTHRSGALGAALPMDPRQARRARAVALLAIVALLALWLAVLPGDATAADRTDRHAPWRDPALRTCYALLGSLACIAWATAVTRRMRSLPLACGAGVVAAAAAFVAGLLLVPTVDRLIGLAADILTGLHDVPPSLYVDKPSQILARGYVWNEIELQMSSEALQGFAAIAASAAAGWMLGRRAGPAGFSRAGMAFIGVLLAVSIAGTTWVLDHRSADISESRATVATFHELRSRPAADLLEQWVSPSTQRITMSTVAQDTESTGMDTRLRIDPRGLFAGSGTPYTAHPLGAALFERASDQPEDVRRAATAIAGDASRPLQQRVMAVTWLGPAAAAEFAARELPRATDDLQRLLLIDLLQACLKVGARDGWTLVASGSAKLPRLAYRPDPDDPRVGGYVDPCTARVHALIMLQLLRWQADGTHPGLVDRQSLRSEYALTLTSAEGDAARRALEAPMTALAAAWRAGYAGYAARAARLEAEQRVTMDLNDPNPAPPQSAPWIDCMDQPLSELFDSAQSDPAWLVPPAK
jgi:hypothetical protein